jgi:hypothetical protein
MQCCEKVFAPFSHFLNLLHIFDTDFYQIFNQNVTLDKWNLSEQITQQLHTYLNYFTNNVIQHPMPLCKEVIALFHSITGCATLSCNDCNQTLPVVVDQSLTSLWRKFGPLFHAELL